jgi:hypothetical protein
MSDCLYCTVEMRSLRAEMHHVMRLVAWFPVSVRLEAFSSGMHDHEAWFTNLRYARLRTSGKEIS